MASQELARRIRDRTRSGDPEFDPERSQGAYDSYEPRYAKRYKGRQSPVDLTRTGELLDGMTGAYAFRDGQIHIGVRFSTARAAKIVDWTQDYGIKTRRGLKKRYFTYITHNDFRAILDIIESELGIKIEY